MFNLFKRNKKNISTTLKNVEVSDNINIQEETNNEEDINITAAEAKLRSLKGLYNPTYEKIKKDILKTKNRCYIDYDAAYIDKGYIYQYEDM